MAVDCLARHPARLFPVFERLYFGGNRDKPSEKTHRWMVYCIDFNTGKILWEKLAHQAVPKHSLHIKNTYASETPVTDGRRVYVYFGSYGLLCYDHKGRDQWKKPIPTPKSLYGMSASPIVHPRTTTSRNCVRVAPVLSQT